ncbi:hypothetical protein ACLB2K_072879 [Fragaria x ananassa]
MRTPSMGTTSPMSLDEMDALIDNNVLELLIQSPIRLNEYELDEMVDVYDILATIDNQIEVKSTVNGKRFGHLLSGRREEASSETLRVRATGASVRECELLELVYESASYWS